MFPCVGAMFEGGWAQVTSVVPRSLDHMLSKQSNLSYLGTRNQQSLINQSAKQNILYRE